MTSAVSLASMSDIAFLLIIFFLTASVFVIKDGLRLMLPAKGKTMIVKKPEDVCTVVLRDDASLLLDDRPVDVADQLQQFILTQTLAHIGEHKLPAHVGEERAQPIHVPQHPRPGDQNPFAHTTPSLHMHAF